MSFAAKPASTAARDAPTAAPSVGERIEDLEILGAAERPASGDDTRRGLQIRTVGLACGARHEAGVRGQLDIEGHGFHRRRAAVCRGLEGCRAHRADELGARLRRDGHDGIARVGRAAEVRGILDRHDVAHLRAVEKRRHARHQILAEGGRRAQDVREVGGERDDLWREKCRERFGVGGVLDLEDPSNACKARGLRGERRRIARAHRNGDRRIRQRARAGDALGGGGVEGRAVVLGDNENFGH